MATSSPHASVSGCNRAIQDTWRANLAAKGPFSRRGTRNHAWREDVASAARPFSGSSLRSGGTGFAPCDSGMRHAAWPNGLCALRRGPGLLAACAPLSSRLYPPRPAPPAISPAFIAAVLHVSCFATRIAPTAPSHPPSRPLRSGRAVDQALPAALVLPTPTHRAHRCALAGTARPQPAPTEPQPRANRVPPTRGAVCAHPRPATRCISPCRVGPAAVLVIPAKWCGDTIVHTRKLRF